MLANARPFISELDDAGSREKITVPTLAPLEQECTPGDISGEPCRCFRQLDSKLVTFAIDGGRTKPEFVTIVQLHQNRAQ
jgi:hypothetical protein